MIDYMKDYECVKGYFSDELSRRIFDYKINDLARDSGDELINYLYGIYPTSKIMRFDDYYRRRGKRDIIIYGTGKCAERDYRALAHAGYRVAAFIDDDSEQQGSKFLELPVLSLGKLMVGYREAIVIVSNEEMGNVYYNLLISIDFPRENIFKVNTKLRTEFGNIYFDLPELMDNVDGQGEIFIDAGAFDGESSLGFIKWCKENSLNAEKIYLFEPMHDGIIISQDKLRDYPVEYLECGLGKEDAELHFEKKGNNLMGSRVKDTGDSVIRIKTIDGILAGGKATFIKMDIEGSEAAALYGAAETIRKYRPKLAISMYHKRRDILELPKLVKEINPDYKLYLRHYSNMRWDFVMYAI